MGRRHRATVLWVLAVVATPIIAAADPGYVDYTSWSDWARLRVGVRAGLASSFDRTGGTDRRADRRAGCRFIAAGIDQRDAILVRPRGKRTDTRVVDHHAYRQALLLLAL